MGSKVYVGDAVYAEFTQWGETSFELVLTTENGISVTNRIVLEPQVWDALVREAAAFLRSLLRNGHE